VRKRKEERGNGGIKCWKEEEKKKHFKQEDTKLIAKCTLFREGGSMTNNTATE
jgi:hypothetical protein